MKEKTILEIRVDRLNEKGVFVAEQILNILHDTLEEIHTPVLSWFRKKYASPDFAFEIANIQGVLRFFFVAPNEYAELLEHQIYAHYPQIEISRPDDYIRQDITPLVAEAKLDKDYVFPIKIYTDFKERSEKETVDPFSSVTSALSKAADRGLLVYQVTFGAIHDRQWKNPKVLSILLSKHHKIIKKILLSPTYQALRIFLFPIFLLGKFIEMVIQGKSEQSEDVVAKATEKGSIHEDKLKNFGYQATVRVASYASNEQLAKSTIKEVGTSLNIFARPGSNGITLTKPSRESAP